MINQADSTIQLALDGIPLPKRLTVTSLFAVVQDLYPRPLELLRGEPPIEGLRANGLWVTRPGEESDAMWVPPELTGSSAVHSLAHEFGHFRLEHEPVVIRAKPKPAAEDFQFLSTNFLGGCLLGRARSQDTSQDPEYIRVEDQAEQFAFLLRRKAAVQARENRHSDDPLLDRLYKAL